MNHWQSIAPGESFTVVLGVDPLLRVSSKMEKRISEDGRTRTYTTTATLKNTHDFDLERVVVRAQGPVFDPRDTAESQAVLRKPPGLADLDDDDEIMTLTRKLLRGVQARRVTVRWSKMTGNGVGGKKDGMFEWECNVGAGEELRLEAEWDVNVVSTRSRVQDVVLQFV